MDGQAGTGWQRRDLVHGVALLALVLGLPASAASLTGLAADDMPSARQRALLRAVCQLVIPRTATPGAGDVGAGDFVLLALAHGLEGSRKPVASDSALGPLRADGSLDHAKWLEADLNRRAKGDFLRQPKSKQVAVLTELDGQAFAPGVRSHPWRTIKALILTGYYTSEIGGATELRYELVPGRFDPDVLLKPGDRAFSSDWTAVDFG